jgi:hypothetical protein
MGRPLGWRGHPDGGKDSATHTGSSSSTSHTYPPKIPWNRTKCQPKETDQKKQGFYIGKDLPLDSDKVRRHPELLGQNMFPPSLPESDFRVPTERYYAAVMDLSMRVLEILAKGLPYGDDIFHDFVSNDPVCIMRLLHYPPQEQHPHELDEEEACSTSSSSSASSSSSSSSSSRGKKQLGAGAHTDFGTLRAPLIPQRKLFFFKFVVNDVGHDDDGKTMVIIIIVHIHISLSFSLRLPFPPKTPPLFISSPHPS